MVVTIADFRLPIADLLKMSDELLVLSTVELEFFARAQIGNRQSAIGNNPYWQ